ncbi:MAG: tRNA lysidine(34) synthetase TilS, partial [Clostridia bacterium]|nr:tRNA lysidine(34) synthetase TilS [Clostridia bacterium]
MKHKVLNTLKTHSMLGSGDRVIVALSGGADSVTLFNVLLSLQDELGIEVYAAHVNHNLRGQESLRDEAFVKKLCKENNVELFIKSVDVNALCKETSESFETVGRRVRYDFFEELSEQLDAVVATAHTLSDSLETALFNMARGASFAGLSSIPYRRGRIIRPLLDVTRE